MRLLAQLPRSRKLPIQAPHRATLPQWRRLHRVRMPVRLNPRCTFKHEPGQKKNTTNKWVAQKEGEEKEHVSERKFVDEDMPEEPIIPGQTQMSESVDVAL
jgi:hypothetical protein